MLDLIDLSTSLYHISLADRDNPDLFRTKDIDTVDISDSNTDNDLTDDDDSDNDNDDTTTIRIPKATDYSKQTKDFDRVELQCSVTTEEKDTWIDVKSNNDPEDVLGDIYTATIDKIDFLKAEAQKRNKIQGDFINGNDHANTSKDPVETINDRVPTTIASDVDTDIGKKLLDNRSTTATTKSNEQPMVKKTKTNITTPSQQKTPAIHLSTAVTSNSQGVTGVTDKATTTTPTTITTDSTVNDNDTKTSAISDKIWSPKQTREL